MGGSGRPPARRVLIRSPRRWPWHSRCSSWSTNANKQKQKPFSASKLALHSTEGRRTIPTGGGMRLLSRGHCRKQDADCSLGVLAERLPCKWLSRGPRRMNDSPGRRETLLESVSLPVTWNKTKQTNEQQQKNTFLTVSRMASGPRL